MISVSDSLTPRAFWQTGLISTGQSVGSLHGVFEIVSFKHCRVLWILQELWYRVLQISFSQPITKSISMVGVLTLDISLKTEVWASLNRETTSWRLVKSVSSSPTALVIRPARLFRRLWSILSSQGEPGARKAL